MGDQSGQVHVEFVESKTHQYDYYINNNIDHAGAFETLAQGCPSHQMPTYHSRRFLFENL